MFLLTVLAYPAALAALCVGAGLLLDACSGSFLPGALLPAAGAALLVAVSQLCTYVYPLATATPYVLLAAAAAGLAAGRRRLSRVTAEGGARALTGRAALPAGLALAVYLVSLAPVLAGGRASFSDYTTLADSAVHMLGARFLLEHGQHYAHVELASSTGRYISFYYGSGYPSGADTLYGASTMLLGLPLIWTFQPFNAFLLALASGPALLLARRIGIGGALAALAAFCAVCSALVYAYGLFGSIKELAALVMTLALGCLVAAHRAWLLREARRALPFGLIAAAGISSLGLAFGIWALAATVALLVPLAALAIARPRALSALLRRACAQVVVAALAAGIAALPTWAGLSSAFSVASSISSTSNPGNLPHPLAASQLMGVWLNGAYNLTPKGAALVATDVLVVLATLAALAGAARILRRGQLAIAGWVALMVVAWVVVSGSVTTWGAAKALMLTSPVAVLLAWGGAAALRSRRAPAHVRTIAPALALVLAGGVLASDAMQYHASNLAPTARYEALRSLARRISGRGPAVFADFDEYSMELLADVQLAGPDFVYPPPALAAAAQGHGEPVHLIRASAAALARYPLVIMRTDPSAERPPAQYRLWYSNAYYELWRRSAGAPVPLAQVALSGSAAAQCGQLARFAGGGVRDGAREGGTGRDGGGAAQLIAAREPQIVSVPLSRARRPRAWRFYHGGLVMDHGGELVGRVTLPSAGRWRLWLEGQFMPRVSVRVDGRSVETVSGEVDGNSLVWGTVPARTLALRAGVHTVELVRGASGGAAPGETGVATLDGILLTPASQPLQAPLASVPLSRWQALCGAKGAYQWAQIFPGAR